VPLPAPAPPARSSPPPLPGAAVRLPPPSAPAHPTVLAPPAPPSRGAVPLPAPGPGAPFGDPSADPFVAEPLEVGSPPALEEVEVEPEPFPTLETPEAVAPPPSAAAAGDPFASAPFAAGEPAPPGAGEPLAFGEVDFDAPVAPAPVASSASARSSASGEDLEMLFGERAPKPPAAGVAFRVRRRSGKIFGPFGEGQIVEMLAKGELMGNEDVSAGDADPWSPIASVPSFGEALRKLAEPVGAPAAPPLQRAVVYGERMAAPKVVDGRGGSSPRRLLRIALPVALGLLLVAGAGVGARAMGYGLFFTKLLRGRDASKVAPLLAEARAALARDDCASERSALDLAARALAGDPDGPEAAALHAVAVAALERRHAAPPGALDQARRAADRLDDEERGELSALAARLAVTLATTPGAATAPHETALDRASQGAAPDPEALALLARAALARGDADRAGVLYARLEAVEAASPRAPHGLGLVAVARGDLAGAKGAFAKALAKDAGHLPTHLELAALARSEGDAAGAEARLAPLLAADAAARLGPAERGRALALRAELLARAANRGAEADRAFEAALEAAPRLAEVRIALARHRLRRDDAAGAVAALEPVAQASVGNAALAAVRIRALAMAGRALDAASLAEQALQRTPGDPALLLAKAAALEASGKGDEAASFYQDAAARDPNAFEPRLALGRLALGRRDLPRALSEIRAAVEKGPREPSAHAALGELEAAQGEAGRADAAFRAALALDPDYVPAEIGLAKLALARGDAAGARARFEHALAADPRSVEGHVAYGTLLWKGRELAGAERELQTAVDLQPLHPVALARLGAVKLERGEDVDGAVTRLSAATHEAPALVEARHWLGRALLKKGETPGAVAQLRKAVELEPGNPEHHLHLGAALERSGALQEAVEAYRASAAADPRYAEAHERLGVLFAANARWEDALAAYEKANAVAPRVSRLRIGLGDCKAKLGRHEEAVKVFRDVLRAEPGAVQVLYRLARSLHEAEGAKAALPWYERAARDEAANPMPHYYLGYLYKERNQKARAIQEFNRYLALKPDADERKDIEAEVEDLGGRVGR
jgi:tetratricopeptide (TPR) repeat protein